MPTVNLEKSPAPPRVQPPEPERVFKTDDKTGLISIIMPTVGRAEQAAKVVRQTVKTTQGYKLEFVCPVDVDTETPKVLVDTFLELGVSFVIVWQGEEYLLHARSWNRGLRHADGEYIVFFADDCWPHHDHIDRL